MARDLGWCANTLCETPSVALPPACQAACSNRERLVSGRWEYAHVIERTDSNTNSISSVCSVLKMPFQYWSFPVSTIHISLVSRFTNFSLVLLSLNCITLSYQCASVLYHCANEMNPPEWCVREKNTIYSIQCGIISVTVSTCSSVFILFFTLLF